MNIDKFIPILEKKWRQPFGLFIALLLAFLLGITLIAAIKATIIISFLIIILFLGATLVAWLYAIQPPKTKKGKVGFAVSLWCSDEEAAYKVREDFVLSLQRLIKSGQTGHSFQFIEIPAYTAEKVIDQDDAQELRLKTKAHFIIYGRVRARHLNGSESFFLELDGIVAHRQIAKDLSQKIANEFSELLPRKVILAREQDLLSFQFTSEWADVVAKYIIGIAAAVSGDLKYAEELYSEVLKKIQNINITFPVYVKLRERIPQRLAELFEARAKNEYNLWMKNHDKVHIERLGNLLEEHDSEDAMRNTLTIRTLSAIYFFLSTRDIENSENSLNQIPKTDRDASWYFNKAFLSAYKGDLKQAIRHYRNGMNYPISPDLITQVEEFLCNLVEEEPEKVQMYYCLGFLNWKIKGDNLQAAIDFNKFLSLSNIEEFEKEKELSTKWLSEIKAKNAS